MNPFASFLHTLHEHHTLLTFCEFQQAHAFCIAPYVQMTHVLTASRRLSTHACTAHEAPMHMPHVTSNFMIHPRHPLSGLSGRPTQFVHMIPAFTSSKTLTGRTGRLHIFQTLVPSYIIGRRCSFRARVFTHLEPHAALPRTTCVGKGSRVDQGLKCLNGARKWAQTLAVIGGSR